MAYFHGQVNLPTIRLEEGYELRIAMNYSGYPAPFSTRLEQSQMVGVPGLQRTHQQFELGKHA
jgi:hypothetical protein